MGRVTFTMENIMVILDKRLRAIAESVRENSVFADIGTDHAYIPIFLITKGICKMGYASDLRQGPLDSARKNLNICHDLYLSF